MILIKQILVVTTFSLQNLRAVQPNLANFNDLHAHLNREDLFTSMMLKLATNRPELADSFMMQAGGQKY